MNSLRESAQVAVGEGLVGGSWCEGLSELRGASSGRRWMLKVYGPEQGERALAETTGLDLLRTVDGIDVPEVVWCEGPAFLMTYLESSAECWDAFGFGRALANLHGRSNDQYGAPVDTFCGPTRQSRGWDSDWWDFFWSQRLFPLCNRMDPLEQTGLLESLRRVHDLAVTRWAGSCLGPRLVHGAWVGRKQSEEAGHALVWKCKLVCAHRS